MHSSYITNVQPPHRGFQHPTGNNGPLYNTTSGLGTTMLVNPPPFSASAPVAPQLTALHQQHFATNGGGGMHFVATNMAGTPMVLHHHPMLQTAAAVSSPPAAPTCAVPSPAASGATPAPAATTFRNLKVGGLPSTVTDSDLYNLFERFGKIESAKVMLNVQTCESRGYGFVLFDSQEAGCRAFGEMSGKSVTVRDASFTLDVKSSDWDGRQAAIETNTIYVRNIPNSTTEEELRSVFEKFGTIVSISTRLQPHHHGHHGHHHHQTATSLNNNSIGGQTANTGGVAGAASPPVLSKSQLGATPQTEPGTGGSTLATSVDSTQGNLPTEPLQKLAMIEYTTVDAARQAIGATHRQWYFPTSGNISVLSKFADPPQLKESKRQMKKQHQAAAPQHNMQSFIPLTQVAVGHRPVAPPPPPGTTAATAGQQSGTANVLHHYHAQQLHHMASSFNNNNNAHSLGASYNGGPSVAAANSSSVSNMVPSQAVRFPDAVPLPLVPRSGHQRIFFQGTLGITPDGILYPIRPEMCYYEAPPTAASSGPSNANSTSTSGQQQTNQRPWGASSVGGEQRLGLGLQHAAASVGPIGPSTQQGVAQGTVAAPNTAATGGNASQGLLQLFAGDRSANDNTTAPTFYVFPQPAWTISTAGASACQSSAQPVTVAQPTQQDVGGHQAHRHNVGDEAALET